MENFKNYVNKMHKAVKLGDFPVQKDHDYTVTFLQPEYNTAEGIFRTLLPAYCMTQYTNIRSLCVGMSENNGAISINEKKYEIKQSLISITDHMVFPFVSYPLKGLIEEIKNINPKIKLSYYIDYNYYYMPDSYPFVKEYAGSEFHKIIEENITLVDQVIINNKSLYKFLLLELSEKEQIKGCGTQVCLQPSFYDKTLFPALPEKGDYRKKVRFGMVLNNHHFADLNFIKGILKEFLKKHSENAELVVLGWNGVHNEKNYLKSIDVEYHEAVPFWNYYDKLIELDIDCFIIPAKNNKFNNTSRNINKLFDFGRLNIPIIAPDIEPYKEIGMHNDNCVLCDTKEQWMFELETYLKDPEKYAGLADRMYNEILSREISEKENINVLMELYQI